MMFLKEMVRLVVAGMERDPWSRRGTALHHWMTTGLATSPPISLRRPPHMHENGYRTRPYASRPHQGLAGEGSGVWSMGVS
jgi:hypothetical protein